MLTLPCGWHVPPGEFKVPQNAELALGVRGCSGRSPGAPSRVRVQAGGLVIRTLGLEP